MDRKRSLLLLAGIIVCLLLLIVVGKYRRPTSGVTGDEKNSALLGLRGENEGLFSDVTPTGNATSTPVPSREPTKPIQEEKPLGLLPMEVVEKNRGSFDDLLRLLAYGVEPARSKFEILAELRPYTNDSFHQFYDEYFRHLEEDVELPEYWPTQEGVYAYVYGSDGYVADIVSVDEFVEQYGYYPKQMDIIVIEESNPQALNVSYQQSEEDERTVDVVVQDTVRGGETHMHIYFDADGRVWYFY